MSSRRRGVGRPGALEEARELVALVASLSDAGDALSVAAVAERLGVDEGHARKLVGLVLSSTLADGTGLPLVDDGGELTLVGSDGIRGRRLRLTRGETLALTAALDRLGIPACDPLRARLESQAARDPIDERLVRRLMSGERGTDTVACVLENCGRARARRRALSFTYRKSLQSDPERRSVVVTDIRCEDGTWYLTGIDLSLRAIRTFRVDRMEDAEIGDPAPTFETPDDSPRMVRLTFSDPRFLTLLPWHDLHIISARDEVPLRAETPYFGGGWLTRMLAACGGTAHCDDPAVEAEVRAYARAQLSSP